MPEDSLIKREKLAPHIENFDDLHQLHLVWHPSGGISSYSSTSMISS